jgi:predicted O-methyltransferase YrrM
MKRMSIMGLTFVGILSFMMSCTRDSKSTGSVDLDRIINADYGQWEWMIKTRPSLLESELKRLNPHYEAAKRESITTTEQKVVLSLMAMKKRRGVIVELGSWTGGGVLLMAPYLASDRTYHAVDTFNADTMPDQFVQSYLKGRKHLDVFIDNIAPLENKVVVHQGLTNDIAATWPKGLAVDLLFIDADHAYDSVSADWRNWSPFVRKGGIVAFHDYYSDVQKYGHAGVRKFVDELRADPSKRRSFYTVEGLAWYVVG